MENRKNRATVKDCDLRAHVWHEDTEQGRVYGADLVKLVEAEDGTLTESHSFTDAEILRIARLANAAYGRIVEYKHGDEWDAKRALEPATNTRQ